MTELEGKRVLVVGLARSGRAVAYVLGRHGARVTVTDSRPPSEFRDLIPELTAQKIGLELGLHRKETFLGQNLIVVSPGVPLDLPHLEAARRSGIPIIPEIEVAGWLLKGKLVGITGTNGKTTTTTLLGEMLKASGFPTFVGGNLGVPLSLAVDQVSIDSLIVAELSSFQLEIIRDFHPHLAVLLNLSRNHLDRHPSFEAYARAKARIFRNQTAADYAILNADDPQVMALAPHIESQKIFFSGQQNLPAGVLVVNGQILYRIANLERVIVETREVALRGAFNLENVLAAAAAACVLGADAEAIREAVRGFGGVEHRLEFVREVSGVEFFNDSKATSVEATAKALSAFERNVHLIMGGKDKGAPYTPLRPLLDGRVRYVFLIGAAAARIAEQLSGAAEIIRAGDLETAVRQAFRLADPGAVVLLSPACSSFDQFQDFEHRGRVFKELVERLAREAQRQDSGIGTEGGDAHGPNPKAGSRITSPESQDPNTPLASAYEVASEEIGALDFAPPAKLGGVDLRPDEGFGPLESVVDEVLPFEVRGQGESSSASGEDARARASGRLPSSPSSLKSLHVAARDPGHKTPPPGKGPLPEA